MGKTYLLHLLRIGVGEMKKKLFDVVVIPGFNFVHKDLSVFSDQIFEGALSVNFVVTTEDVLNLFRVVTVVVILVRGAFKIGCP